MTSKCNIISPDKVARTSGDLDTSKKCLPWSFVIECKLSSINKFDLSELALNAKLFAVFKHALNPKFSFIFSSNFLCNQHGALRNSSFL